MAKFINLTPHTVKLNNGTAFEPSGTIARVSSTHTAFDSNGIASVQFGEVTGLPEPAPETFLIVSALVAAASKRPDVISPATGHPATVREQGQIVSVPGFVRS